MLSPELAEKQSIPIQVFGSNRPRLEHIRNLVEILYIYVVLVNNQVIYFVLFLCRSNRIGGVMVNVLALSAVERGLEPRSGKTKDYKIGICCFSDNWHLLARNQNNVSRWGNMSTRGLLLQ